MSQAAAHMADKGVCQINKLVIYKRGCYCLRFSFKMKVIG